MASSPVDPGISASRARSDSDARGKVGVAARDVGWIRRDESKRRPANGANQLPRYEADVTDLQLRRVAAGELQRLR